MVILPFKCYLTSIFIKYANLHPIQNVGKLVRCVYMRETTSNLLNDSSRRFDWMVLMNARKFKFSPNLLSYEKD